MNKNPKTEHLKPYRFKQGNCANPNGRPRKEEYITKWDAARIVGISTRNVDEWVRAGRMITKRKGQEYLVNKADFTYLAKYFKETSTEQCMRELKDSETEDGFIPLYTAAKCLKYKSPRSVMQFIYHGTIKGKKIGNVWYIHRDIISRRKDKCVGDMLVQQESAEENKPIPDYKNVSYIKEFLRKERDKAIAQKERKTDLEKIKDSLVTLARLLVYRDKFNGGWKADWESDSLKPAIYFNKKKEATRADNCFAPELFTFKDNLTRDLFYSNFKDELQTLANLFN